VMNPVGRKVRCRARRDEESVVARGGWCGAGIEGVRKCRRQGAAAPKEQLGARIGARLEDGAATGRRDWGRIAR